MAIEVVIETPIARPVDVVFARIADVDAWPSWLIASGILSVARSSGDPITTGERLTVTQRAAGRSGTFEATVRDATPPSHLAIEGRDADGVTIAIDATVSPAATGATLRWSISIGLPFRYRIFESMAKPEVQRAAALDVEALRRGLEATPKD
jgi:uncharacterized protein YndB with AHSA1/START domain